jgi:predicted secreted protein
MPNTGMPYSGAPTAGVAGSGAPESYLVWAIITTLLCCLPFGIVSIVNAVKVDKLWMQGQQEAAYKASKNAKIWAIVAAAAGGVVVGGWFLIALLAGMSGV